MAEIKNPKGYYYTLRNRYVRSIKQIGHKLALALTEEEDAALWSKYKKILEQWRALPKPMGISYQREGSLRQNYLCKPIFNEKYTELTRRMVGLYGRRSGMIPSAERDEIDREIEIIKEERKTATVYINRETGETIRWK